MQLAGLTDDQRWNLLLDLMRVARGESRESWERAMEAHERAENLGSPPEAIRAAANEALREGKDQSHEMIQCLRREAVWRKVAPHTPRAHWLRGLNLKTDVAKWIHTERLRGAAYPRHPEGGE
jgi:hypothetical protein